LYDNSTTPRKYDATHERGLNSRGRATDHPSGLYGRMLFRAKCVDRAKVRQHPRETVRQRVLDHGSKDVLAKFGRVGRQAGEWTALHNIAVDHQGNIYTAEVQTGARIQRFRRIDAQD
jgi:hypothetical protein